MNRDVASIVHRYIHRYHTTSFQLDYQEKFGRWWHHQKQFFWNGLPVAVYRSPMTMFYSRWSNHSIFRMECDRYLYCVAPLPKNY